MKAPAFQWYPKDIETDEAVVLMDNREFGAYVHLLNHGWLHNGIPCDEASQAKIVRETIAQWRKMWPAMECKWVKHPSDPHKLVNPRQELEREKQADHKTERSEAGKRGAEKRWHSYSSANGSASGLATQEPMANDSSASASASATPEDTHPSPHDTDAPPTTPPLLAPTALDSETFSEFEQAYREAKPDVIPEDFADALIPWRQLAFNQKLVAVSGIRRRVEYGRWRPDEPHFIPPPSKYLRSGEWKREVYPPPAAKKSPRELAVERMMREAEEADARN